MTDPDLLAKKLAFVESCVADLRRFAVAENIDSDIKERRFVEHTLQLAIQACLDATSHVGPTTGWVNHAPIRSFSVCSSKRDESRRTCL